MRQVVVEQAAGQRLRPGRGGPLPHPDRHHTGGEQQHVAALNRSGVRLIGPTHPQEPRMVRIDQVRQRRLALPGRQRQRGDGEPRPDPERRVPGEHQVRQWVDHEVTAVVHPPHQRGVGGGTRRQLGKRHSRHQDVREVHRRQGPQVRRKLLHKGRSQPSGVDRGRDSLNPGSTAAQCLGEQVTEQQYLDTAGPQHLGERIVLLLGTRHPGQAVEEQGVVVAGCQPLQFQTGSMQDHCPQPADFRVHAQRTGHTRHRIARRATKRIIERLCDMLLG